MLMTEMGNSFPAEAFTYGLVALFTKLTIALATYFGSLRVFDWLNGIRFRNALKEIFKDPAAVSDYYGRRHIGVALVILAVCIGSI